uniref:Uncharacterized protein n=1 Tax=Daphnia galeata TaxID=27404 RepID=A0A8J2RXP2_9CRUS|nr:unnamed protein product [Daphnia galeata]
MSGASDNDDFDDENANPNTSHVSQPNASSTEIPVKKLAVPAEFFTCVGEVPGKNASLYRCLHPGCVPKKKRDGSEKPLVVYHSSRCNAKRHFLNHDPTKDLGHMKLWEDAVKHLDNSTSLNNTPISVNRRVIILQEDLDNWVLNFLIVDVLPIYTVEKPGFKQLVHTLVPNLVLHGRTFFTNKLETMYNERRLQLIDALRKSTDAATTIDAWTSRGKAYLGETIHWFDGESLKRRSACLGIRRIKERHTYDGLTTMIEDLHKEYEVVDKLRGATTDNGSNFFKAFRESGDASDVPSYEDDDSEQSDEEDNMLYFEIGNILDARIRQEYVSNNVNPTLPMHRKCTCYLLSLIAKADISKIPDPIFQKLRNSTT